MSNLPLNINLTQIFLHLLNFLILFAILYFLLYKPVKNFMEKREKTYRDMDDEARDNLRVSEETKAQYESKMSEADSEISQMKQKSRQEIEKNRDSQMQAASETPRTKPQGKRRGSFPKPRRRFPRWSQTLRRNWLSRQLQEKLSISSWML